MSSSSRICHDVLITRPGHAEHLRVAARSRGRRGPTGGWRRGARRKLGSGHRDHAQGEQRVLLDQPYHDPADVRRGSRCRRTCRDGDPGTGRSRRRSPEVPARGGRGASRPASDAPPMRNCRRVASSRIGAVGSSCVTARGQTRSGSAVRTADRRRRAGSADPHASLWLGPGGDGILCRLDVRSPTTGVSTSRWSPAAPDRRERDGRPGTWHLASSAQVAGKLWRTARRADAPLGRPVRSLSARSVSRPRVPRTRTASSRISESANMTARQN